MRMSAESIFIKRTCLIRLASQATAVTFFEIFFEKVKVLVITFHMNLYTTPELLWIRASQKLGHSSAVCSDPGQMANDQSLVEWW